MSRAESRERAEHRGDARGRDAHHPERAGGRAGLARGRHRAQASPARDVRDSRALTRMVGEAPSARNVRSRSSAMAERMTINATIARLQEGEASPRDRHRRTSRRRRAATADREADASSAWRCRSSTRACARNSRSSRTCEGVGRARPPTSAAPRRDVFRAGDVIVEMAFQPIDSMIAARAIAARAARSTSQIVVKIDRGGASHTGGCSSARESATPAAPRRRAGYRRCARTWRASLPSARACRGS